MRGLRRPLLTAAALIIASFAFRNDAVQSVNWTFPYFSGAANFVRPFDWKISPSEYANVVKMDSRTYLSYRHQAMPDAIPNIVNSYGYVLVVRVARSIFFWMGDGNATVTLQVLSHLAIVLVVQSMLATAFQKNAFLIAYGVNPVVIHFVTFPFYYFWAVIPSVALVVVALRRRPVPVWLIVACAVLLYLAVLIRPTTLFIALLVFAAAWFYGQRTGAGVALVLFITLLALSPRGARPAVWHPAYVGIGAFSNADHIRLDDESAFEHYEAATGKVISTNAITGTFQNPVERDAYYGWLKTQVVASIRQHSWAHFRNAVTFTLQAFGLGFLVGYGWLNIVTVGLGILVLGIAWWSRQHLLALGIGAYAVAFTPYFPPIPAYLFGAYILTALIIICSAETLWKLVQKKSW